MAHDRFGNSDLIQALGDVFSDLSDLLQKEIHLAKAELTDKVTSSLQAGVWLMIAAFCCLLAAGCLVGAAVFAIASFGIPLYWACLVVAIVLGALGAVSYFHSRALAEDGIAPKRALRQVAQDIKTAKEQLT